MVRERYSFIILVLISVILSGSALMISIKQNRDSDRKWCQVVDSLIITPAIKPADPKKDPSRERSYEIYIKLVNLDKALGC